jgi:hypothetical protein
VSVAPSSAQRRCGRRGCNGYHHLLQCIYATHSRHSSSMCAWTCSAGALAALQGAQDGLRCCRDFDKFVAIPSQHLRKHLAEWGAGSALDEKKVQSVLQLAKARAPLVYKVLLHMAAVVNRWALVQLLTALCTLPPDDPHGWGQHVFPVECCLCLQIHRHLSLLQCLPYDCGACT